MSTTTPSPTVTVPPRLNVGAMQREVYQHAQALAGAIGKAGLEQSLVDLIDVRISQINGCAFCIQMHTQEAREHGESDPRLHALGAWEEASVFTARERAALALAEAITEIREGHVPDAVWEEAAGQFSEPDLASLLLVSSMMNFWNRLAITSRTTPVMPK
ncbi:MAG: carboxymuconolactone decarboxylase family protein [Candidatus Dormibacteraceae bacterium]